jgi:hypothetical protein
MAVPRPLLLAAASFLALAACNRAPAEPDGQTASSTPSPAVSPLLWDAPSTWSHADVPGGSPRKAAYRVPPAGNDTAEGEAEVQFFGTGAAGDPAAVFKEWFDQFDGNAGASAARERFKAGELEVETVEVAGTYKVALARAPRARKAAVQMVKKGYRLYGAVVRTKDRGNWFFKLVGPDETVQAARSAFRGMVESAR